jgi:hypothetical protein
MAASQSLDRRRDLSPRDCRFRETADGILSPADRSDDALFGEQCQEPTSSQSRFAQVLTCPTGIELVTLHLATYTGGANV